MKIYKAFLHTIFLVGIQTLIGIAIILIFQLIDKNLKDYYQHALGLIRTFAQLSGFIIFSYYFWKPWKEWISKSDFKTDNFKIISLLFIIGIGLEFIKSPFIDFNNILKYINHSDLIYNPYNFEGFDKNLIYRVVGVIIIAPIIEELFFRKYLINRLLKENSKVVTLITSSICFSSIHFETPNNLIPAFLFGLASGLIFIKTNKIGYSILLHLISNSLWLIDVVSGDEFYNYLFELEFNSTYWMIFIFGIIMTYFGLKKIKTANN
jgi:membrane protease YdiL (CAAX protease family)